MKKIVYLVLVILGIIVLLGMSKKPEKEGYIYVGDSGNARIQVFDRNGKFIKQIGSYGHDDGQFFVYDAGPPPLGICLDKEGNLYVADTFNYRIQKFDKDGKFLMKFGKWGGENGEFKNPSDVIIDYKDNIYVVDSGNHRIQKFDKNGKFLMKFGSKGSGDSQFNTPYGIGMDIEGNIYVVDTGNCRIQKFDKNGKFLMKFGSKGSGDGQFGGKYFSIYNMAINSESEILVPDRENQRIQKFSKEGKFLMSLGGKDSGNTQINELYVIGGIAVDKDDDIYGTAGNSNHEVRKFSKEGKFLMKFGSKGRGDGQFFYPLDIYVNF